MTALSYPSAAFPALPTITLDVPDDWQPIVVPATLLAVAAPEVAGEFRPNLVAAITRFTANYTLDAAEQAVREKFASFDDAHEIGVDRVELNGVLWSHVESTFSDPRVGTIVQAAHLAVVANGDVVDLVQLTGSATGTQAKSGVLDVIRTIQRSAAARA